jgi:hypothetical protein
MESVAYLKTHMVHTLLCHVWITVQTTAATAIRAWAFNDSMSIVKIQTMTATAVRTWEFSDAGRSEQGGCDGDSTTKRDRENEPMSGGDGGRSGNGITGVLAEGLLSLIGRHK